MQKQSLTSKQVEYIKANPAKRLEVPAGPPLGLYLVVHSTARKSWALRYRVGGIPKKLTFAIPYPALTLAAARGEAEAALAELRQGKDPAISKAETGTGGPNGVRKVAAEWIERYLKPRTDRWPGSERMLVRDVLPFWEGKLISEVGRSDVLRVLDTIVERGAPIAANRTFQVVRSWFNWCLHRGLIPASPITGMRAPASEKSRERFLSNDELRSVWKAAESLGYPTAPFLQLLILTAQRRGEVASIRWQDVDFDTSMWTLPREQTKADRAHDVPLSRPALALLKNLPRFQGPFIFTSKGGAKPINGFPKMKARLDVRAPDVTEWTMHDLRRTAATGMARAGVSPHVLAAILNHAPASTMGVTQIYNRFRYVEERRSALAAWGELVLSLVAAPIVIPSKAKAGKRAS